MVDRMVREGRIRSRRIGKRVLLLNAADVERELAVEEDREVETRNEDRVARCISPSRGVV